MNAIRRTVASITGAALMVTAAMTSPLLADAPPPSSPETSRVDYRQPDAFGFPQSLIEKIPDAFAREAQARMIVMRANAALTGTFTKMRFNFSRSDGYRTVATDEKSSFQAYQAARDAALAKLANDEQYKAVTQLRDELADKLADLRTVKGIRPEDLVPLAEEKLNYARTASAMEAKALAEDPGVAAARDKFVAAGAKLATTKTDFDDTLRYHPDVEAARNGLADAKINSVTAAAYTDGLLKVSDVALDYAYYVNRHNQPYITPTYDYYGYGGNYSQPYKYYGYGSGR